MEAHLHRVEVQRAVAGDHDLAVERGVRRELVAELRELREVAEERALVPAPERKLAAVVLEHAAEAVPLRLVLPVALRQLADELGLHRRKGDILARHVAEAIVARFRRGAGTDTARIRAYRDGRWGGVGAFPFPACACETDRRDE